MAVCLLPCPGVFSPVSKEEYRDRAAAYKLWVGKLARKSPLLTFFSASHGLSSFSTSKAHVFS